MSTEAELMKALEIAKIALETITDAGPKGIPSGHLYAVMMPVFQSLETYESMIGLLIRSGLIERNNHVLTRTCLDR